MNYCDAVLLTKTQAWHALDPRQKVEVLQSIEDHAAASQGREPREVKPAELYAGKDSVLLGYYAPYEQKIYVNSTQFDPGAVFGADSSAMVDTVLHEGRHAYQNDVVEGLVEHPDAAQKASWAANLGPNGYVSFDENPRAYYEQPVEKDARAFAEQAMGELVAMRDGLELSRTGAERPDQLELVVNHGQKSQRMRMGL